MPLTVLAIVLALVQGVFPFGAPFLPETENECSDEIAKREAAVAAKDALCGMLLQNNTLLAPETRPDAENIAVLVQCGNFKHNKTKCAYSALAAGLHFNDPAYNVTAYIEQISTADATGVMDDYINCMLSTQPARFLPPVTSTGRPAVIFDCKGYITTGALGAAFEGGTTEWYNCTMSGREGCNVMKTCVSRLELAQHGSNQYFYAGDPTLAVDYNSDFVEAQPFITRFAQGAVFCNNGTTPLTSIYAGMPPTAPRGAAAMVAAYKACAGE